MSDIATKQYGNEEFLAGLVAEACSKKFLTVCYVSRNRLILMIHVVISVKVLPKGEKYRSVDNVRICKIPVIFF